MRAAPPTVVLRLVIKGLSALRIKEPHAVHSTTELRWDPWQWQDASVRSHLDPRASAGKAGHGSRRWLHSGPWGLGRTRMWAKTGKGGCVKARRGGAHLIGRLLSDYTLRRYRMSATATARPSLDTNTGVKLCSFIPQYTRLSRTPCGADLGRITGRHTVHSSQGTMAVFRSAYGSLGTVSALPGSACPSPRAHPEGEGE
jgi:hypothetical protein